MKKLRDAKSENLVDTAVIPLIDYINSLRNFYTTSSCSGRISVFCNLITKLDSFAIKKWHRKVTFDEVMDVINSTINSCSCSGSVWIRQEPSIFHIVSKDLVGAAKILDIALNSGYKYSGLQVLKEGRYLVEVLSTERVDAPIVKNGELIVSGDYIKLLTDISCEKFEKSREKLEKFEEEVRMNLK